VNKSSLIQDSPCPLRASVGHPPLRLQYRNAAAKPKEKTRTMLKSNYTDAASQALFASVAAFAFVLAFSATTDARAAKRFGRDERLYSASVSFADLNLTNQEDIERLERRVRKKARHFCRVFNGVTATQSMLRECREKIVEENRSKIEKAIELSAR
jgi:UrcA family protein